MTFVDDGGGEPNFAIIFNKHSLLSVSKDVVDVSYPL